MACFRQPATREPPPVRQGFDGLGPYEIEERGTIEPDLLCLRPPWPNLHNGWEQRVRGTRFGRIRHHAGRYLWKLYSELRENLSRSCWLGVRVPALVLR